MEEFSSEPEKVEANSTGELLADAETYKIGDNVNVKFEGDTATISGTGDMWNFLEDGWDLKKEYQNPFECYQNIENIHNIIIEDGITNVSDYFFPEHANFPDPPIKKIQIGKDVKRIGKYAFSYCSDAEPIILPEGLEIVDEHGFAYCKIQSFPSKLKKLGNLAFQGCKFENPNAEEIIGNFTEIPKNCFESTNLASIKLGTNITAIGQWAFSSCGDLNAVELSENLMKIGNGAFEGTGITTIQIPAGVSEIGASVFSGCRTLSTVEFEGENLVEITSSMFSDCTNLYSIKIPNGVQTINYRAFNGCVRLQEITIPSSVTYIGDSVFENCNYLKIKGYTGSYAEQYAKDNNIPFEPIGIAEKNPVLTGNYWNWTGPNSAKVVCVSDKDGYYYADWVTRGSEAPEFDTSVEGTPIKANQEFTVYLDNFDPDNAIDVYVMVTDASNNQSRKLLFQLEESERPEDTSKIQVGDGVYASIEGDTLTISGSGATYDYNQDFTWFHGEWDWEKVNNVKKIIFDGNITYLGDYFFEYLKIGSIEIPQSVQKLGNGIFRGCINLQNVTFPKGLQEIGKEAFYGCSSLVEVNFPEGLNKLGENSFYECNKLEKIIFPSTLSEIPFLSYEWEWNMAVSPLEVVIIPEGIEKIQENAFRNYNSLKSIDLPNSLKEIGDSAFFGTGLETLVLPEEIESVGSWAFQNCQNLKSIVIPQKYINWGEFVFAETGLETIVWNSSNPVIPNGMFNSCHNLKKIAMPDGVTSVGVSTFGACDALEEISIPETVTEISDTAFSGCSNLKKISIPKSVKYFGNDVFYNCRNLTIYGYKDSAAERYAKNNDIPFVSADYKVVFKNNGRTVKTEYVLAGGNATPPTLDPREGYTLSWDGDYTDIQEDMIINAVWTKDDDGEPPVVYPPETTKYTVTFKDRGKVIKTEKVPSGDAADYPFIYRYGYELSWDKDFSKVTSNMTVNAVWTVIKPSKVTSFTAEVLPKYIRLSWDETEYTGYYLVYRKADSEKEYKQVAKLTGILWSDKQVKPDTGYSYKVIAVRSVEGKKYQSPESDIVKGKIETPKKGKIYSVGKLNYKVMSSTEVSVTGTAKVTGTISVPATVTIIGKVFKVTSVADEAFTGNLDIINVRFGNNVKDIGRLAFYKCTNLEEVRFGKNVLYIRDGAFSRCEKLGNTLLPQNVRRIGTRAFYKCVGMDTLVINTTRLEYLGKNALAIRPKAVIKVPASKYSLYKKRITQTGIYSGTQITKI